MPSRADEPFATGLTALAWGLIAFVAFQIFARIFLTSEHSLAALVIACGGGLTSAAVLTPTHFAATPDQTFAPGGDIGTLNNTDINTDTINGDTQDVLFTMTIDFSAFTTPGPQAVFDFGGFGNGVSMYYSGGNVLNFVATGTSSPVDLLASHTLTTEQLNTGNLNIAATINLEAAAGQDMIGLFINGALVASDAGDLAGNDWSGGNPGGFGSATGTTSSGNNSFAGVGSIASPPFPVALSSGIISGTLGVTVSLAPIVPAPAALPAGLAMLGLVAVRRRRR